MNRAACNLALKDSAACLRDCDIAMNLLSRGKQKSSVCALANVLHPVNSTKRKWQVMLLCRQAAAKQLIDDFRGALDDLEKAQSIANNNNDPAATSIAKDIDDLTAKMNSIQTQLPSNK